MFLDPPQDELRRLMKKHGGVFHHYYHRELVTHTIAVNLPNSKIKKLSSNGQKVVHPQWITDR